MKPTRVVLGPNGWEPSNESAPPGFVAYRFRRSLPIVRPAEDDEPRLPGRVRLDGHPRNCGIR
jgi:hypothetical protein